MTTPRPARRVDGLLVCSEACPGYLRTWCELGSGSVRLGDPCLPATRTAMARLDDYERAARAAALAGRALGAEDYAVVPVTELDRHRAELATANRRITEALTDVGKARLEARAAADEARKLREALGIRR